jgi:signal transduction histidine kinase
MRLRTKILGATTLVLAITVGGSFVALIRSQRAQLLRNTAEATFHLANTIRATLEHAMLVDDPAQIERIVRTVGQQPGLEGVFVLDQTGIVRIAADPGRVGQPLRDVPPQLPSDMPPERAAEATATLVLERQPSPVLRSTSLVPNARQCQGCHPPTQRILGALVVDRSLRHVEEQLRTSLAYMGGSAGLAFLLLTATTSAVLGRLVIIPLANLGQAARAIEAGDYDTPMTAPRADEVGELGRTLDRLRCRIVDHLDQIRRSGHELDIRVAEQQRAMARLVQSSRMASVGLLAGGVAHEINNRLCIISNHLQLLRLQRERLPPEVEAALEGIEANVQRMASSVEALLEYARGDVGARRPTVVNQMVTRMLLLLQNHPLYRGLSLATDLAPDLPPVDLDRAAWEHVILELLSNAREAMPEGGVVTVTTRLAPPQPSPLPHPEGAGERDGVRGGAWVEVAVEDSGPGMAPEDLRRAFHPFFTTEGPEGGMGLGLKICQDIVGHHGGRLRVESNGRSGTRVVIALPLSQDSQPQSEIPNRQGAKNAMADGRIERNKRNF